jgi:putative addiction module component (TIGR02574 family)
MKLVDLPEVKALSTRDKLQLVDELWEDVARDLSALEVRPEDREMLDARWAAFLHNPTGALSLDQIQERIKTLRG